MYWVLGLIVAAVIIKNKKWKKRLFISAGIVFYVFSIPFIFEKFGRLWDVSTYPPTNARYSCVIVLGGFSSAGGVDGGHFTNAADRFIQSAKLLTTKRASHILISGGNGNLVPGEFREATWVKTQLNKLNIPDSLILIESNSRNTLENARFSKVLLDSAGLKQPYLLVSSAFHLRRSLMIFKHAGMDVVAYPSNFMTGDNRLSFDKFIPASETLTHWAFYTKEIVGYAVNYFK